ncbi:hypothetical protein N7474_011073 [Penicillium riverlandense]|uniref:uncharacterized protein n=1 Tax=Penicillium riverlandense TaxID=1903569 RepID=UPI0025472971|nr:uncharacterized protein N7474_011073 [Penicillium riverlandense]KAJ5805186.1 hypothetical protein N7474_011073 [Penicillium riverlandense]
MERLSLNDSPAGGQQQRNQQFPQQNDRALGPSAPGQMGQQQQTSGPPQLPPQMFTTAAQLLDLTDTNLVLQETIERIYAGNLYADVPRGIFLVRGENVLLLGEVDLDREDDIPSSVTKASFEEVFELKKKEDSLRKSGDKKRHTQLAALGFEPEHSGEILF